MGNAPAAADAVKVKICGLTSPGEAFDAVEAGADAVGTVFAESPRRVTSKQATLVASAARAAAAGRGRKVEVFGLFVNEEPARILDLVRAVPLDVVQLHGDEPVEFARALTDGLAGIRLVRAVRVRGPEALAEVEGAATSGYFEAVLLDAFDERARGGTGRTFDWEIAARAARIARVILAGGLRPDNVAEAVRLVRPYMVDVSSGIESAPGMKDRALVEEFVRRARSALDATEASG